MTLLLWHANTPLSYDIKTLGVGMLISYLKISLICLIGFLCINGYASDENGIPDREPDIRSIPANISDYYIYDSETGKWIWIDDYRKKMKEMGEMKEKNAPINKFKIQPRKKPIVKKPIEIEVDLADPLDDSEYTKQPLEIDIEYAKQPSLDEMLEIHDVLQKNYMMTPSNDAPFPVMTPKILPVLPPLETLLK